MRLKVSRTWSSCWSNFEHRAGPLAWVMATQWAQAAAARAFAEHELLPLLPGEDCATHERIWGKMLGTTRASSGGPLSCIARAAADIAACDIKAKACGMPLYKLLGAQERVPVYDTEPAITVRTRTGAQARGRLLSPLPPFPATVFVFPAKGWKTTESERY
jgi:L-alanine-DL-glutamate epimerase-like enolase superfamily enzyme